MRNLVRNAVAHTSPGDRIVVAARGRDGRLEISVSDSGPGIPPDQLEQIFERFRRLDESRSRDQGGSGLGLAIARAITQATEDASVRNRLRVREPRFLWSFPATGQRRERRLIRR